jgi:hypothetical protein
MVTFVQILCLFDNHHFLLLLVCQYFSFPDYKSQKIISKLDRFNGLSKCHYITVKSAVLEIWAVARRSDNSRTIQKDKNIN